MEERVNLVASSNPLLNSFPNDKNLDVPNLKAFADDKINVTKTFIYLFFFKFFEG